MAMIITFKSRVTPGLPWSFTPCQVWLDPYPQLILQGLCTLLSRRNRFGLLHGGKFDWWAHYWRINVQHHPLWSWWILQQNSVLLLWRAAPQSTWRSWHAGVFLHWPGVSWRSLLRENWRNSAFLHLFRIQTRSCSTAAIIEILGIKLVQESSIKIKGRLDQ